MLALARLNHLCESIREIYSPGAEVCIASDGLVFDAIKSFHSLRPRNNRKPDIVGILDETTWNYSHELSVLMQRHGFKNLKLVRVMDILGLSQEHLTGRHVSCFGQAVATNIAPELWQK